MLRLSSKVNDICKCSTVCFDNLQVFFFPCLKRLLLHNSTAVPFKHVYISFFLFLCFPFLSFKCSLVRYRFLLFSFLSFLLIDFFPCCCFSFFSFGTKCRYLGALNLKFETYGNKITRHNIFTLQTQLAVHFIMKVNENRDGKVMHILLTLNILYAVNKKKKQINNN